MAFHLSKRRGRGGFSLVMAKNAFVLLWIAEQKGFLSDENLKIDIRIAPYSLKGMEMLLDGEVDCAAVMEPNIAWLGYMQSKTPIKCVASVQRRSDDQIIMRGIESAKPEDLKGKTLGFMPRTTSHTFLMRFLQEHDLDKKDINLKALTPQVMPDALIRGDVEAISVWNPYALHTIHSMRELGIAYTLFENTGFYASEVAVATTKSFLIKNEKSLRDFLGALDRAADYFKSNPKESLQIIAHKMNVSPEMLSQYWHCYDPRTGPADAEFLAKIRLVGEWIGENDTQFKNSPMPDYDDFIDNRLFS